MKTKANFLIEKELTLSTRFAELKEVEQVAIYIQPGFSKNKALLMLTLQGVGSVADGGTQVSFSLEVGKISIQKIERKDGFTKVCYCIEGLS